MAYSGAFCRPAHHLHFDASGTGRTVDREKALAPKVIAALNQRYGLDKPLWQQL